MRLINLSKYYIEKQYVILSWKVYYIIIFVNFAIFKVKNASLSHLVYLYNYNEKYNKIMILRIIEIKMFSLNLEMINIEPNLKVKHF